VIVLKRLQTEVFQHLCISNDETKVREHLDYLLQVTTGHVRRDQLVNIFMQGRQQFANPLVVPVAWLMAERDTKFFMSCHPSASCSWVENVKMLSSLVYNSSSE
jgi:hypothetical protein